MNRQIAGAKQISPVYIHVYYKRYAEPDGILVHKDPTRIRVWEHYGFVLCHQKEKPQNLTGRDYSKMRLVESAEIASKKLPKIFLEQLPLLGEIGEDGRILQHEVVGHIKYQKNRAYEIFDSKRTVYETIEVFPKPGVFGFVRGLGSYLEIISTHHMSHENKIEIKTTHNLSEQREKQILRNDLDYVGDAKGWKIGMARGVKRVAKEYKKGGETFREFVRKYKDKQELEEKTD